jgi:hypothetical protein
VEASGLEGFEITWRADVFSGTPQESSAADFDTKGIYFHTFVPNVTQVANHIVALLLK